MQKIIISDTTAITNLIAIGKLEILLSIFQAIVIPKEVYDELCVLGRNKIVIDAIANISIKTVINTDKVNELSEKKGIDLGESASIILAEEILADLLIIDERKGRQAAEELGLNVTGLLGVLRLGKHLGKIAHCKPILDALLQNGFRLNPKLYYQFLSSLNEI
jgi:uncharacterized protein